MKNLFHRKNRRGFTLIELVTAFAILGITAGAVGGFLITGAKSYQKNNQSAAAQQEVRLGMNRIDTLLKEVPLGLSYNVISASEENGSRNHFAASDREAGVAEVKYKVLYFFGWNEARDQLLCRLVRWDASDGTVACLETEVVNTEDNVAAALDPEALTGWETLAMNIENFSFDLTEVVSGGLVSYTLRAVVGRDEYESTDRVNLRNEVLLNPESIGALYDEAEIVIETTITGVSLSAASGAIVKGGNAQLTAKVLGSGFPSQQIHRWVVEEVLTADGKGMEGIEGSDGVQPADAAGAVFRTIYDSLAENGADTGDGSASVNSSTRLLYLSEESGASLLRVTASVTSGEVTFSDSVYISVKEITGFKIRPERDSDGNLAFLNLAANKKLKELSQEYPESVSALQDPIPSVQIFAGNELPLEAVMEGTNLTESDKRVSWNIVDRSSEDLLVTVSADGVVMAGQYTKSGTVLVKAYPYLDPTEERFYQITVTGLEQDPDTQLEITGAENMNRGASLQLGLCLNGVEVDELSDYEWSVRVSGAQEGEVTGSPAAISKKGLLTVSTALSYEYAFTVTVTASLKTMPEVTASVSLRVPKVELKMSNATLPGKRGTTIGESALCCTLTGIEKGEVNWTVASATNPNYYNTILSNGTYLTVSEDTRSASLTISAKEPENLSYFRVKASLKGYSSISAITYVSLKEVSFVIESDEPEGGVERGSSAALTAKFAAGGEGISTKSTRWELVSAKDASGNTLTLDGISLSGEWGSSVRLSVVRDYWLSDKPITVTVRAELSGITAEGQVMIAKEANTVIEASAHYSSGSEIRGGYWALSTDPVWSKYEVNWKVVSVTGGSSSTKGISLSESASQEGSSVSCQGQKVYLHVDPLAYILEQDVTITVQAVIQGIVVQKALTVPKIEVTLTTDQGYTDTSADKQSVGRGSAPWIELTGYSGEVEWSCSNSDIFAAKTISDNTHKCSLSVPLDYEKNAASAIPFTVTAAIRGSDGSVIRKSVGFSLSKVQLTLTPLDANTDAQATISRGGTVTAEISGFSPSQTKVLWSIGSVSNGVSSGLSVGYAAAGNYNKGKFSAEDDYYLTTDTTTVTLLGKVVKAADTGTVILTKTVTVKITGVENEFLTVSGEKEVSAEAGSYVELTAVLKDATMGDISEAEWSIGDPLTGVSLSSSKGETVRLQVSSEYEKDGKNHTVTVMVSLGGLTASAEVTVTDKYPVTITADKTEVKRGGTVTFTMETDFTGTDVVWTVKACADGNETTYSGTVSSDKKTCTVKLPADFDTGNHSGDTIKAEVSLKSGIAGSGELTLEVPQVTVKVTRKEVNKYTVKIEGYDDAVKSDSTLTMKCAVSRNSNLSAVPSSNDCNLQLNQSDKFNYTLEAGTFTYWFTTYSGISGCGPVYVYAGIGGLAAESGAVKIIALPASGWKTDKADSSLTYSITTGRIIKIPTYYYGYMKEYAVGEDGVVYMKMESNSSKLFSGGDTVYIAWDGTDWYKLTYEKGFTTGVESLGAGVKVSTVFTAWDDTYDMQKVIPYIKQLYSSANGTTITVQ